MPAYDLAPAYLFAVLWNIVMIRLRNVYDLVDLLLKMKETQLMR
jgi:hypothetical protein